MIFQTNNGNSLKTDDIYVNKYLLIQINSKKKRYNNLINQIVLKICHTNLLNIFKNYNVNFALHLYDIIYSKNSYMALIKFDIIIQSKVENQCATTTHLVIDGYSDPGW